MRQEIRYREGPVKSVKNTAVHNSRVPALHRDRTIGMPNALLFPRKVILKVLQHPAWRVRPQVVA
jgi:hypothetical protein